MSAGLRLALGVVVSIWVLCQAASVALAGTIGYPAARQERLLQVRIEVAGDSFRERMEPSGIGAAGEYKVGTGRALLTVASGVTDWSEIYARVGTAEFQIEGTDFNGSYGTAYGGGVRLRLLRFGWGVVGVTGQYLRFTSSDDAPSRIDASWEEFEPRPGRRHAPAGNLSALRRCRVSPVEGRPHGRGRRAGIRLRIRHSRKGFRGPELLSAGGFPGRPRRRQRRGPLHRRDPAVHPRAAVLVLGNVRSIPDFGPSCTLAKLVPPLIRSPWDFTCSPTPGSDGLNPCRRHQVPTMNPESSPFRPGRPIPIEFFVGRRQEVERLHGMVKASVQRTGDGR